MVGAADNQGEPSMGGYTTTINSPHQDDNIHSDQNNNNNEVMAYNNSDGFVSFQGIGNENDDGQMVLMNEHEKLTNEVYQMRDMQAQIRDHLIEKNRELAQLKNDEETGRQVNARGKLSNALKLISKMKSYEIK